MAFQTKQWRTAGLLALTTNELNEEKRMNDWGGTNVANAYAKAGVDVEAGYEVVERIKKHVKRT